MMHKAWIAILFVVLMLGCQHAYLEDFSATLQANIATQDEPLNNTPTTFKAYAAVRNTGERDWIVYLLSNNNGTWKNERLLGVVQPGKVEDFAINFEARYNGMSKQRHEYAVVATGDVVPLGKYFAIEEDWSAYEAGARRQMQDAATLFIPTAGGLIFILIAILAQWAYSTHSAEQFKDEYTMRSLFMPKTKGRPLGEVIADVMIHPLVWLAELAAVLAMAGIIWDGLAKKGAQDAMELIVLGFMGALLVPLFYFAIAWAYNRKVEKMPLRFMAGIFLFGAAGAVVALYANTFQAAFAIEYFGIPQAAVVLFTTALMAPLIEEIIKGLGLFVLRYHHEFASTLHGLHLGLAVGLGFSFVENWFYFASKTTPLESGPSTWIMIVLYRSFFNSVSHGFFSAMVGATLGWAKSKGWGKFAPLALIPGLTTAIGLHSLFNITATMDSFYAISANFPVLFNPTLVIMQFGLLLGLFAAATMDHWQSKLGNKVYQNRRIYDEAQPEDAHEYYRMRNKIDATQEPENPS